MQAKKIEQLLCPHLQCERRFVYIVRYFNFFFLWMKTSRSTILFGLLIIIVLFLGGESLISFLDSHTYYSTIFTSNNNWGIFFVAIIAAIIPVLYLTRAKLFKLKTFYVIIAVCAAGFGMIHSALK